MKSPTNSYHASSDDSTGCCGNSASRVGSQSGPGLDWTKPLQTKTGCSARLLYTLNLCESYREPRIVLVDIAGVEQCLHYYESGDFKQSGTHPYDLVNVKPDQFVNIWATRYPSGNVGNVRLGTTICGTFSEAQAIAAQAINRGESGVLLATINLKDI